MIKEVKHTYLFAILIIALFVIFMVSSTAAQSQTAGFYIDNGRLLDANGADFVMRGVNHPHAWYPGETGSIADIKAAGANAVRVVLASGDKWAQTSASEVQTIIQLCKANQLICVLEVHDTTGYGESPNTASLAQAVAYWTSIQSVLTGEEAYVIINIGNEPYGNVNYQQWVTDTEDAIIAMRNAGFEHTLMIDAPNWGQDWSFTMRDNAQQLFATDPLQNLIFSIHMYGVFDTAAEIENYLTTFVNSGLPIAIGEFGFDHSDGDPDEDAIMSWAESLGIGYLGWSWSGNGGGVEYLDMVNNFDGNSLTTWGERLLNGANGIAQTSVEASVFGTPPPTSTPGPSPTPSNTPPATNTPTPAPTADPSTQLSVQYYAADTNPSNSDITPYMQISNGGNTAVNLSELTARYYFTREGSASLDYTCFWASMNCTNITGSFVNTGGSDFYLELSFDSGTLAAGANTGPIHQRITKSDWSAFDETDDHSYDGSVTSFADSTTIVLLLNGSPVWGVAPGGTPVPTVEPTVPPTVEPTTEPTVAPTVEPTTEPTVAPTVEPTMAPTVDPNATLRVQYRDAYGIPAGNEIKPYMQIINDGATVVSLSDLTVRYYFTREGTAVMEYWCFWSPLDCANNITGTFVNTGGSDFYLELSFASGTLAAGASTGPIEQRINMSDWTTLDQTNDHSYDGSATSYADSATIVLLLNGTPVWGAGPNNGPLPTPTNTPAATNTPAPTNTPTGPTQTPVNTPTATNTPMPTNTPTVTNTPAPTNTPTITPTPNPSNTIELDHNDATYYGSATNEGGYGYLQSIHTGMGWDFNVSVTGEYRVTLHYSTPIGQRINFFGIDGSEERITFPATGEVITDYSINVMLDAGSHTALLSSQSCCGDFDGWGYMRAYGVTIELLGAFNIVSPANFSQQAAGSDIVIAFEKVGNGDLLYTINDGAEQRYSGPSPLVIPTVGDEVYRFDFALEGTNIHKSLRVVVGNPPDLGFVEVDGTNFVLHNQPWYFNGTNQYYLMFKPAPMADDFFARADSVGLNVVRTWMFCHNTYTHDGACVNLYDGGVSSTAEQAREHFLALKSNPTPEEQAILDYSWNLLDNYVWQAQQYDIKLVLALGDNWPANRMGAIDVFAEAVGSSGIMGAYANAEARELYKMWIDEVLNHVNPYTGLAYKDDPTIMMWELGNEPRCTGSGGCAVGTPAYNNFNTWVADISAHLKQEAPNQLVSIGTELDPNDSEAFIEGIHSHDTVDVVSAHLYPKPWNIPTQAQSVAHVQGIIDVSREIGKPLYYGEFSYRMESGSAEADAQIRTGLFNALYDLAYQNRDVLGGMISWQLSGLEWGNGLEGNCQWCSGPLGQPTGKWYGNHDGYQFYCVLDPSEESISGVGARGTNVEGEVIHLDWHESTCTAVKDYSDIIATLNGN